MEFYFDYSDEALKYILSSNILRNRDKKILVQLANGKKTKEIAYENNLTKENTAEKPKTTPRKTKESEE